MAENDPALLTLIEHGHEERNLEYKGSNTVNSLAEPFAWGPDEVRAKIARSAMAMANIGGGAIVIGMDENKATDTWAPNGVSVAIAASYRQDDVQRYINERSAPYVVVTVRKPVHDGRTFVVIQVSGFEELPVVCSRGSGQLRQGAVYTRARTMHSTVEVQAEPELRELLDRAIEAGVRRRLRPLIEGFRDAFTAGAQPAVTAQFLAERENL